MNNNFDNEFKEDLKIIKDTHDCGTYLTIRKWGDKFECSCDQCNISSIWKDTEEAAIKFFKTGE